MPINLTKNLISWLLPLIEKVAETELLKLLQSLHDTHQAAYTQLLIGVYPLIDVQLEDYVATTGNKVDDEIVAKLKSILEQSAAANNVTLPNLDGD